MQKVTRHSSIRSTLWAWKTSLPHPGKMGAHGALASGPSRPRIEVTSQHSILLKNSLTVSRFWLCWWRGQTVQTQVGSAEQLSLDGFAGLEVQGRGQREGEIDIKAEGLDLAPEEALESQTQAEDPVAPIGTFLLGEEQGGEQEVAQVFLELGQGVLPDPRFPGTDAREKIGYIILKSEWDHKPPDLCGAKRPAYGKINSVGPEIAGTIHEALRELCRAAKP